MCGIGKGGDIDQVSTAKLEKARMRGRENGLIPDEQGASCPYGHKPIELRAAWFDGFSEGRTMLEQQRQDCEQAVGVPVDP